MSILANITVNTDDITKVCPDASDLLFSGQADFSNVVDMAKQELYGLIKEDFRNDNPDYDNEQADAQLVKVKDYPEEKNLKRKLIHIILRIFFGQLRKWDLVEYYAQEAEKVPLMYYVDIDADSKADTDEEKFVSKTPRFGR